MLTFTLNEDTYKGYEILRARDLPKTEKGRSWLGNFWCGIGLKGDVNIDAYGRKCYEKEKLKEYKRNECSILTGEELEGKVKGVTEDFVKYVDKNIEEIIESSDIVQVSEEFLDIREYIIAEIDVDILYVVEKVREGKKQGIAKLKEILKEFELNDIIEKVVGKEEYYENIKGLIMERW